MRHVGVVLLVVACGGPKGPATVTVEPVPTSSTAQPVVHAPAPSVQAFLDAGCQVPDRSRSDLLDCKDSRVDYLQACQSIHVLPVTFDPPAVVAECFVRQNERAGDWIRSTGCMMPMSVELVAASSTGLTRIRTQAELAKAFAPVTSADEAIAFAVALTGNEQVRTRDADSKTLGTTEVRVESDGFHVRLFGSQMCGCSHPTWAVEELVTRDGKVAEQGRKQVWEDPKSRGLCVD